VKPDLRVVVSNSSPTQGASSRGQSQRSTRGATGPAAAAATAASSPASAVTESGASGPVPVAEPTGETLTAPEQVEMPFAVINGELITALPRDLYIPPQALEVFLEAFEGPLDLLLYLIRRQNLDVLNIPIAQITRQYMQYIELMQDLQLELAGEYLVMAATLAEIKSRMLLPRPAEDQQSEEDPRAELVRRLQEYERFKRAAADIDALPRLERDAWQASAELSRRSSGRTLPQVTLQEMLIAFKEVAARAAMFAHHHVQREALSVRERMSDVLAALRQGGFVEFSRLFRPQEGRAGVTVTFIALLELLRESLIDVVQSEPYAPLYVRATTLESGAVARGAADTGMAGTDVAETGIGVDVVDSDAADGSADSAAADRTVARDDERKAE
jgi:segregation and condensation protein A